MRYIPLAILFWSAVCANCCLAVTGRRAQFAWSRDYPWFGVVQVARSGHSFIRGCGAALIESNWVVTATHCMIEGTHAGNFYVSFRRSKMNYVESRHEETIKRYRVRRVFTLTVEEAAAKNLGGDLALLQLEKNVDDISPVQWRDEQVDSDGQQYIAMGFGMDVFLGLEMGAMNLVWANKPLKSTVAEIRPECAKLLYNDKLRQLRIRKALNKYPSVIHTVMGRILLEDGKHNYDDSLYLETNTNARVSTGDEGGPLIVRKVDEQGGLVDRLVGVISLFRDTCFQVATIAPYMHWIDKTIHDASPSHTTSDREQSLNNLGGKETKRALLKNYWLNQMLSPISLPLVIAGMIKSDLTRPEQDN